VPLRARTHHDLPVHALPAVGPGDRPGAVRVLLDASDLDAELDAVRQPVGIGEGPQIREDLPVRRIVREVVGHREAAESRQGPAGDEMGRLVHRASGIVDVPDTAGPGVPLEMRVRQPSLRQSPRDRQPGRSRPDHTRVQLAFLHGPASSFIPLHGAGVGGNVCTRRSAETDSGGHGPDLSGRATTASVCTKAHLYGEPTTQTCSCWKSRTPPRSGRACQGPGGRSPTSLRSPRGSATGVILSRAISTSSRCSSAQRPSASRGVCSVYPSGVSSYSTRGRVRTSRKRHFSRSQPCTGGAGGTRTHGRRIMGCRTRHRAPGLRVCDVSGSGRVG
jgi:hypothetical protein